jgi:PST family polysaccharide transporter
MLQRKMRFTTLSAINVTAIFVSTSVAIAMAMAGFGYWALAAMVVANPIVMTIGALVAGPWLPGLPRRDIGLRSMVHFGGAITLNCVVVYIAYNLEKVLLGRFWGADAIGLYGRAYQLVNVPTDNLNTAVGEVAFSALSRVQDDPQKLRNYFLKGYSIVLALTIPITLLSTIFAGDLISVLLGPKWHEAVPIFRYLAPTIAAFAMINPFGWLLFATGKIVRSLKIAFVIAPLVITGYLIGLPHGPKGVALGYSVAMGLWVFPNIVWCVRDTAISVRDVLRALRPSLVSGLTAALVSLPLSLYLAQHLPLLARLALEATVFSLAYLLMLLFVMGQKPLFMALLDGLRHRQATTESAVSAA